eukprot:4065945-Prorocentrum_lima.AAC.1
MAEDRVFLPRTPHCSPTLAQQNSYTSQGSFFPHTHPLLSTISTMMLYSHNSLQHAFIHLALWYINTTVGALDMFADPQA